MHWNSYIVNIRNVLQMKHTAHQKKFRGTLSRCAKYAFIHIQHTWHTQTQTYCTSNILHIKHTEHRIHPANKRFSFGGKTKRLRFFYPRRGAYKYSLCCIFRDLQDSHSFAPLRSRKFSQKSPPILRNWILKIQSEHHNFRTKTAISRRNWDEILSEFR